MELLSRIMDSMCPPVGIGTSEVAIVYQAQVGLRLEP